ncbi:MAG: hypothetical protein NTY76_07600 [Candidatus Omnitrophica bacterium]|nr:hypothetical protein [Candidatus Omnitrophota bacterium]
MSLKRESDRMKKVMAVVLAILLMLADIQIAIAFMPNPEALKDSKPEALSIVDQLYLRYDTIDLNSLTKIKILVNRLTNRVEYVFNNGYKRYIRPKFVMPDAQALYDKTCAGKIGNDPESDTP